MYDKPQEFWDRKDAVKRDEIAWAQAFNLAVASLPDKDKNGNDWMGTTLQRQGWFYRQLKAKPTPQGAAPTARKHEVKDIAKDEAENDAGNL